MLLSNTSTWCSQSSRQLTVRTMDWYLSAGTRWPRAPQRHFRMSHVGATRKYTRLTRSVCMHFACQRWKTTFAVAISIFVQRTPCWCTCGIPITTKKTTSKCLIKYTTPMLQFYYRVTQGVLHPSHRCSFLAASSYFWAELAKEEEIILLVWTSFRDRVESNHAQRWVTKNSKLSVFRFCFPDIIEPEEAKPFYSVSEQLRSVDDFLFTTERIVLKSRRAQVIASAHDTHGGIMHTKARLREWCGWPRVNQLMETPFEYLPGKPRGRYVRQDIARTTVIWYIFWRAIAELWPRHRWILGPPFSQQKIPQSSVHEPSGGLFDRWFRPRMLPVEYNSREWAAGSFAWIYYFTLNKAFPP